MRKVSIRDLSADAIGHSANDNEILGVTSKGAIVGVLVPLTHDMLRRFAVDLGAEAAAVDADSAATSTDLRDVLQDAAPSISRPGDFARVSIREITGARLEQASLNGEQLVVTSDRVSIAVFLPLPSQWVDRLVEDSVTRFLAGKPVDQPDESARAVTDFPPRPIAKGREPARTSGLAFSSQRAIGVRIVGDARNDRQRIVGVVTDGLARTIKVNQITLPLEQLDETYVFERILTLIDMLISRMSHTDDLIGVGIEIGGHVFKGRVVHSTNIHWDEFPLAELLSERLGLPVTLENDANALAIHERYIAGISDDNFAVVLLTHLGVGCGLILDGCLHRGSQDMAAELGHIPVRAAAWAVPVDADPLVDQRCRCGNSDCLEAAATPQAIENMLRIRKFAGDYDDALKASDNDLVEEAFKHAGAALGNGIATVLNLLNPKAVVLYGPLELVGPPRQFHIDKLETAANVTGFARVYVRAMTDSIRNQVFSNADECRFIVRSRSDEQGAKAAAACVIRAITDGSAVSPRGNLTVYAERSR